MPCGPVVIVADEEPQFRASLIEGLSGLGRCFLEADHLDSAKQILKSGHDVVLVLLGMATPGVGGLAGLFDLRSRNASLPIVMVSHNHDGPTSRHALQLGASAVVSKREGVDAVVASVRTFLDGGGDVPDDHTSDGACGSGVPALIQRLSSLTPQQARVLALMAEGQLNKQIAYELGVSLATVKAHVTAILRKLEVTKRAQAVACLAGLSPASRSATF